MQYLLWTIFDTVEIYPRYFTGIPSAATVSLFLGVLRLASFWDFPNNSMNYESYDCLSVLLVVCLVLSIYENILKAEIKSLKEACF